MFRGRIARSLICHVSSSFAMTLLIALAGLSGDRSPLRRLRDSSRPSEAGNVLPLGYYEALINAPVPAPRRRHPALPPAGSLSAAMKRGSSRNCPATCAGT